MITVGPHEGTPFILPTRGHGLVKLDSKATDDVMSAFEIILEPGQGPGEHVHTREHELWYVLAGEFRFLLGDKLVHQPTGGLAFGPRGVSHTFQNVGNTEGRLLVITARAGLESFFLTYDRLATGPYDPEALAAAAEAGGIEFTGPPLAAPSSGRPGGRRGEAGRSARR
jgi:mannose-6-phosphate isomerase-like protein (cupin superfamily)